MSDETILLEAQTRLDQRRRDLDAARAQEEASRPRVRVEGPTDERARLELEAYRKASVMAEKQRETLEVVRRRCERCGNPFTTSIGELVCIECFKGERAKVELQERLRAIPERFRNRSLETPPDWMALKTARTAADWLRGRGHLLTIGARHEEPKIGDDGRPVLDKDRRPVMVAKNPTGSGKTTLAGMVAHSAAKLGKRITWIDAADLDAYSNTKLALETYERILASSFAVIDGWGKEFTGTPHGSDLCNRKKVFSAKLANKIHTARKGQRFVITFDVTREQGIELYGVDTMRRLIGKEYATAIGLTAPNRLELARI